MIRLREFRPGDEPALRAVFESAIHGIACRDYTPEQLAAWAPRDHDPGLWARRMQGLSPFVAERGGVLVAYADVQADGVIDHFFVSAPMAGQGIGRLLMERLHERAAMLGLAELMSDVSLTAQAFFARFGFEIVEHRRPMLRGVVLSNALMRKKLSPAAA